MSVFSITDLPKDLENLLGEHTKNARAAASHFDDQSKATVNELLRFACDIDQRAYTIKLLESYAVREINGSNRAAVLPLHDLQFLKDCITRGWPNC
jgi:hypothetical protein